MIKILEEILRWMRVTSIPHVKKLLTETLQKPEHKLVYSLSDGRSTREVQRLSGVDFRTVANLWNKWYKVGIVDPMPARGRGQRYCYSFSLEDFNIQIPRLTKNETKPEEKV